MLPKPYTLNINKKIKIKIARVPILNVFCLMEIPIKRDLRMIVVNDYRKPRCQNNPGKIKFFQTLMMVKTLQIMIRLKNLYIYGNIMEQTQYNEKKYRKLESNKLVYRDIINNNHCSKLKVFTMKNQNKMSFFKQCWAYTVLSTNGVLKF